MYEIIRTIYSNSTVETTEDSRISVLQQTLSQLRLTNIATLDACMNHFTRLIDLTSADEEYVANLTSNISRCILRPRAETSLTMEEKHSTRLVRDLFTHKDAIFSELKRMSTLNHSSSVGSNRPRAVSTDESNRKALVEERNRALVEKVSASRSRATSPAPGPRGHRRDRSSGGPETRFPIQTSPVAVNDRQRTSMGSLGASMKRASLDVPGADGEDLSNNSPTPKRTADLNAHDRQDSISSSKLATSQGLDTPPEEGDESAHRGVTLEDKPAHRGVTLEDKPMDD